MGYVSSHITGSCMCVLETLLQGLSTNVQGKSENDLSIKIYLHFLIAFKILSFKNLPYTAQH